MNDDLYSTAQAAANLGISEATVKRLAERGEYLNGRKVGSRWVFTQAQLDAFVPPPRGRPSVKPADIAMAPSKARRERRVYLVRRLITAPAA